MQDTKKLNAGLAILILQHLDYKALVPEDCLEMFVSVAQRLSLTELYDESKVPSDKEVSMHCISLIEEYLKEQGV